MVKPRVYVGGIPSDVSERDLEKFFRGYGKLREVLIKNGYGFVEFNDQRDADDAVDELDGKKLLGQKVTVQRARGTPRGRDRDQWDTRRSGQSSSYRGNQRSGRYGPPQRTKYRVIVENLSSRISWQDLKDFMRKAGEVTYADAHREHHNQGVVEFSSYSEMKNAVKKLDDSELNGRRIRIIEDRDSRRSNSHSRSRSRSYRSRSISCSRSRSRSRKSYSRSRSPARKSRSYSRSPVRKSRSYSRSPVRKSRSYSRSPVRKSRSYSRSPVCTQKSSSLRKSSSRSPARKSRSRSPARKSRSPARNSRSRSAVRSSKSNSSDRSPRRSPNHESNKRKRSRSRSNSTRSNLRNRSRSN